MSFNTATNYLNNLPSELQYIILEYLGTRALEDYAATSKTNYQYARKTVALGLKTKRFDSFLYEEPTKKLYHYYIDHHSDVFSCMMQLKVKNAHVILHNTSLHVSILQKVIKSTTLQKLFNWQDNTQTTLHFALEEIQLIIQAFPSLTPLLFKENSQFLAFFKEHPDGKAYLMDIISSNYENATYLLSRTDIIKYLLTSTDHEVLAPSKYLRDLPEILNLIDLDGFQDNYPATAFEAFIASTHDLENELPKAVHIYLRQIIDFCQKLYWQVIEKQVSHCFELYFTEKDVESKYNLSKDLYSVLEASILTTSHDISHSNLVDQSLSTIRHLSYHDLDDTKDAIETLTRNFMHRLKAELIAANQALKPILTSSVPCSTNSASYMEQSICFKY